MLLGLPLDLLVELGGRHHRHGDLADDDRLARDAHGDVAALDLGVLKDPRQALDHRACVHHVAVDDGLRGERRVAEPHELQPLPASLSWQTLIELDPMSTPTRFLPSAISQRSVALATVA